MKTLIECKTGHTIQTLGGVSYSFDRDEHGRFVNEVASVLHRSLFLNVDVYQEVPLTPEADDDQEIPAFLNGGIDPVEPEPEPEPEPSDTAAQEPVKPKTTTKKTASKA
ncbi:hypothetical protein GGQ73_003009 [Rhizobium skierniewicense]|uniref:Uncharacterized protein n=1 Tax=Rhizobium skierniewicense TaxID=984260 RepID=A0A7W6G2P8_9HYPH|nr:hypothetical protein [Rhizobium skierniewicense]MBB3947045.1 hypothetical protein [Rhizobium skierniewicense]